MNKRFLRTSAVTTLAMTVRLGAPTPVSSAAPAKQSTRKVPTVKTVKAAQPVKSSRLVEAARRNLVSEIGRDDSNLARLLSRPSLRSLDSDALTRLASSVVEDRALLAGFAAQVRSANTLAKLKQIAALVRRLRPEIYSVAVGQFQDLAALTVAAEANGVTLADLDALVRDREAGGQQMIPVRTDVVAARLLNSEVMSAIPAAWGAALQLSAGSSRAELQAVTGEVLRISGLLDRVDETIMLVELAVAAPAMEPTEPAASEEPLSSVEPTPAA